MIGNKELAGSNCFLLWTTHSIQRITASKNEKYAIKTAHYIVMSGLI